MEIKNSLTRIFTEELVENLTTCKTEKYERGATIIKQDFYVTALPIVISGTMSVYRRAAEKEILLYYVHPFETCIVSLINFFERKSSYVEVVASGQCEVIFVPLLKAVEWQRTYSCWNEFILQTFFKKNHHLIQSIDDLAFASLDKRIKNYLCQLASRNNNNILYITHQEIANELGTSRVVISRILKNLESEGLLVLLRGAIQLKDIKRINVNNDTSKYFTLKKLKSITLTKADLVK